MAVDEPAEEPKKKKKGKGKETEKNEEEERWELVGGAARCRACVRDDAQCRVNTAAILRWRERVEEGKVTARAPTGTSCERCNVSLKRTCELPGTADLRERVKEKKAELAAKKQKAEGEKKTEAAGGSKRKAADEGVAGPSRKKAAVEVKVRKEAKKAAEEEEEEMTAGEYRSAVVELLGQLVEEVAGVQRGIALHNVLQHRMLSVREGAAATGSLPVEPWVTKGRVRGHFGLEQEWKGEETEEESGEETGSSEEEEESAEEEGDAEEEAETEEVTEGGSGEVAEE